MNFTQDYEWSFPGREPFRGIANRNGKPLWGKLAREEAERMRMTAVERLGAKREPNPHVITIGNLSGGVILTEMNHTESGEETIECRKARVIRANPSPGANRSPIA